MTEEKLPDARPPAAAARVEPAPARFDVATWSDVVDAYEDVTVAIDDAFTGGQAPDLDALFATVWRRLDALRRALPADPAPLSVLEPIAFLLDERVLVRLAGASIDRDLAWPMLGRAFEVTDSDYGGDAFFERAAALGARPHPLLVEVYVFCLAQGFAGRYAAEPDELVARRRALFEKLAVRPAPKATTSARELPRPPRPIWQWALAAVVGAAAVQGLFALVARFF